MLGRYESRTWQYDPYLNAPSRFRRACDYDVFIPLQIEEFDFSITASAAGTVSEAEMAIRDLNNASNTALVPLARLLLRTESIASSKVEGMQIDVRTLARAEASNDAGQRTTPTALEVLANIDAMQLAIENATAEQPIRVEDFRDIHHALLERAPNAFIAGQIRTEQNWIGGNDYNPCGADFVPPPPEGVEALLDDLCRFCNQDRLSPLVQAAIAHAQFETIHPFADGNGRTGRTLVQIILKRRSLAPTYVPPVSVVLAANKDRYISGLTAYREGDVGVWIETFAACAEEAARFARHYLGEVEKLQEQWREMIRASTRIRADAAAWKLIEVLPANPVITLPIAVTRIDRTKPAVNQAIEQLVTAGVLIPISENRRNRAWEASGLLDLIIQTESGESLEGQRDVGPITGISGPVGGASSLGDKRLTLSSGPLITPLTYTDAVHRLGPGSWLTPVSDESQVAVRLAIAMPDVISRGNGGSTRLATQLRGQRREELLTQLLRTSSLTSWLQSISAKLKLTAETTWTPYGSGSPEFTELRFAPFGLDSPRPPLVARCAFLTGFVDDQNAIQVPAIQATFDVVFNFQEVSADRQQNDTRHQKYEELTSRALSLVEVADSIVQLFGFIPLTVGASDGLLALPRPDIAHVGVWLSVTSGPTDQFIDLHTFRRIPRSTDFGQIGNAFELDLSRQSKVPDEDVRAYVANLLYEGLERAGYRDFDEMIDKLQLPAGG